MEEPPAAAMVAVLTDDVLLPSILKRLSPVHLLRAALACHRWRRAAALAIPRAPPLLGCFVHPGKTRSPPPMARADLPAVFVPIDACFPRLSLAMAPDDSPDLAIRDVHFGLVLLLPDEQPEMLLRRIVVLDPASRRRALLPPPPREALPDDEWHQSRLIIGAAVLSRAHPSKLVFEAVCVTLDEDRPRAWVASVQDDDCIWRALPRSKQAKDQLDSFSSDERSVHSKGKIYWPICNSRRVLALDARTLEFSFVVAPVDLGRHFDNYGIGKKAEDARCIALAEEETELGMNQPVFPYYLCWPPEFLATLKGDAWTENMMELVQIAVYNISYIRKLFPEEYFNESSMLPTGILGVKIRNLIPLDEESERLADWITKVSFSYGDDIAMVIGLTGHSESIWTLTSNAAESLSTQLWCSACTMVEKLVSVLSFRGQIPMERAIMVKLMYYDQVTPPYYEPPFFKSCDDMRRVNPQTVHTTLKDMAQDTASLPYDAKSVHSNDHCHAIEDTALRMDGEIQQGYLYCITRKNVKFYFDSGASCHMCGDRNLLKNLQEVPRGHSVTVYDAMGNKEDLHKAGQLIYEQIKLSPVFYSPSLNYNIISLGELDDGNTLIYLGDGKLKLFDVREGIMIGDGSLHVQRNEYIAHSITSIKETRNRMVTESTTQPTITSIKGTRHGMVTESTTKPSMAIEEKGMWIIDSLGNNHLTGNKKIFSGTRLETKNFTTPHGKFYSTQVGTVKTSTITLSNVFYCPGLRSNIISEGQLDRDGYSCTRLAHRCHVQWRATQEIVGLASQDENSIYYVEYCRCVTDPSLEQSKDDKKPSKNMKHSREDGPSSSTSRKRIK